MHLIGQSNNRNEPESSAHFELLVKTMEKYVSVYLMQRKDKITIRNTIEKIVRKAERVVSLAGDQKPRWTAKDMRDW
jgi:hypothetical protein